MTQTLARRAWTLFEPIHATVYFTPDAAEHYKAAGLRGGWMGYFASRSAPMGAVTAEVVVAVFHNFRPLMVARAIPDAWHFSSPERVLEARLAVADATLRRFWGTDVYSADIREAAATMHELTGGLSPDGRPLYAATAGLPEPEAPHLALWHACTLFREHRFDGHIAALTASGVSGIEALVMAVATGRGLDAAGMRSVRGWTEDEWADAEAGLRERGIVGGDDLTTAGRALRSSVEDTTDRLAGDVWESLDAERRERLFTVLGRLASRIREAGGFPYPNPIGLEPPA